MAEDVRKPREDMATPMALPATAVPAKADADETKPRLEIGEVIGWEIDGVVDGASVATELTCSRLFMAGPQIGMTD